MMNPRDHILELRNRVGQAIIGQEREVADE